VLKKAMANQAQILVMQRSKLLYCPLSRTAAKVGI